MPCARRLYGGGKGAGLQCRAAAALREPAEGDPRPAAGGERFGEALPHLTTAAVAGHCRPTFLLATLVQHEGASRDPWPRHATGPRDGPRPQPGALLQRRFDPRGVSAGVSAGVRDLDFSPSPQFEFNLHKRRAGVRVQRRRAVRVPRAATIPSRPHDPHTTSDLLPASGGRVCRAGRRGFREDQRAAAAGTSPADGHACPLALVTVKAPE